MNLEEQLNRDSHNVLVLYFLTILGYIFTGVLMVVVPIQTDHLLVTVILLVWALLTVLFLLVMYQLNRLSARAMEREAAARSTSS